MGVTTTKTVAVTGNQAVAEALRQLNPDGQSAVYEKRSLNNSCDVTPHCATSVKLTHQLG